MLRGAHIFVATIYTAIGLSFFWTTGTLIQEFWDAEWFTLAALHSHLFLFFPIFGIAALIAFYLPSVVFVDMYWRPGHTRLGRTRFCFGMFVVMTLAIAVSNGLLARQGSMFAPMWHTQAANRQHFIWEVRPEVLRTTDTNEPAGCTGFSDRPCTRTSVLSALASLRNFSDDASLGRSVGRLTRECDRDAVIAPRKNERPRLCLASSAYPKPEVATNVGGEFRKLIAPRKSAGSLADKLLLQNDEACCEAQLRLVERIDKMRAEGPSRTSRVHEALLPLKTFFMLVLLVISVLLAVREKSVFKYYATLLGKIEKSVLTGVIVTLPFPFMGQAYKQASELLLGPPTGPDYRNAAATFSVAFGIWAMLILIYFYKRRDKQTELLVRLGGGAAAGLAALNYDRIVSIFVRYAGVGAGWYCVLAMVVVAVVITVWLLWQLLKSPPAPTAVPGAG